MGLIFLISDLTEETKAWQILTQLTLPLSWAAELKRCVEADYQRVCRGWCLEELAFWKELLGQMKQWLGAETVMPVKWIAARLQTGGTGICASPFVSPTHGGLEKANDYDNIKN